MTSNTVLVAGGAGFIGSHVCKALARAGYLPVAYDNLSNGHADAVRWGPLEVGDLSDVAALGHAFATWRPVAVMHFAAFIEVAESVRDPARFYANNVGGTLALAAAMQAAGVGALVFSSTAAVYGDPVRLPMAEDHPLAPINPYGRGKLMAEQMLADLAAARGLRHVVLRYFNAAGADPDGDLGERHEPESHLIPLAVQAALGLRPELAVFGDDYPTPDGTCVRDYVHVSDLATAHVAALRRLLAGGDGLTANVGTGQGHSVRQVIDTVATVTGRPVPHRIAPRRPSDPPELVADAGLLRRELGWRPARPALADQVGDAWRWMSRMSVAGA